MGIPVKTFYDELIPAECDRNANRCRSYKMDNGECVIHLRNYKIVLHTREEIQEWKDGFKEAMNNLGDWFKNDV